MKSRRAQLDIHQITRSTESPRLTGQLIALDRKPHGADSHLVSLAPVLLTPHGAAPDKIYYRRPQRMIRRCLSAVITARITDAEKAPRCSTHDKAGVLSSTAI